MKAGITGEWFFTYLFQTLFNNAFCPLLFAQRTEHEAVEAVIRGHIFPAQLGKTGPADLDLPCIAAEPGIAVRNSLDPEASRGLPKTAEPDQVAVQAKGMIVAAADLDLSRYPGYGVAAGGADQVYLLHLPVLFGLENGRGVFQVGQVIGLIVGEMFGRDPSSFMKRRVFMLG